MGGVCGYAWGARQRFLGKALFSKTHLANGLEEAMSDPDINLLVRLRQRIPRIREMAEKYPDDADDLDLLAYDIEFLWRTMRASMKRIELLESTPGTPIAPPSSGAPIVRLPSLVEPVGTREIFEAPAYEDNKRASSVVSVLIETPLEASKTEYAQIKKSG